MNPTVFLCLLFAGASSYSSSPAADSSRFVVVVNGKFGFIDTSGKVVIPARFEATREFSEGLCAVRVQGRYGFIDTQGEWVVPPRYDYATAFHEGLALVFLQGKPLFITNTGKPAFTSHYKEMGAFRDGRSYVQTYSNKAGIIDKTGRLIVDTVYRYIDSFHDNRAMAVGLEHRTSDTEGKKRNLELTIIDEKGTRLVPYGQFEEIADYSEGYFVVSWGRGKRSHYRGGIMDRQGKIVYTLPKGDDHWITGGVHNGIFRVVEPTGKSPKRQIDSNSHYDVYITLQGKTVYQNQRVESGKNFMENHAFFDDRNGGISIVNRRGELIAENWIHRVAEEGFQNGKACVETSNGWGVLDTTGSCILSPRFKSIYSVGLVDDFIFFEDTLSSDEEYPRYGIADLHGNILVKPLFQQFDPAGFTNGLIKTMVNDCLTYINRSGKIVWQEESLTPVAPGPLNIDYMNRGYFYAGTESTGHGARRNGPMPVEPGLGFPDGALSVVVECNQRVTVSGKIEGFPVYVVNNTTDTLRFNAQDSRLYMTMQALDSAGIWRDIEYQPHSWCGNSYHTIELAGHYYWAFQAPVYTGNIRTKLRIELVYVDPTDMPAPHEKGRGNLDWTYQHKRQLKVYSEAFEGSINAAQFWRRPGYSPSGIMDPYDE